MPKQLTLSVDNNSDALERVLRVVRHRGYAVRRVEAEMPESGERMEVKLELASSRPAFGLVAQLAKLAEVRALAVRGDGVQIAL